MRCVCTNLVDSIESQELENMERDYFDIMFSIGSGIMAILFLGTGLRAILTKRPFLVSNRWFLLMIFLVLAPSIVFSLKTFSGEILGWTNALLLGAVLLMMWYQLKGYVAYAVTDVSFREALLAALQKLQLPLRRKPFRNATHVC